MLVNAISFLTGTGKNTANNGYAVWKLIFVCLLGYSSFSSLNYELPEGRDHAHPVHCYKLCLLASNRSLGSACGTNEWVDEETEASRMTVSFPGWEKEDNGSEWLMCGWDSHALRAAAQSFDPGLSCWLHREQGLLVFGVWDRDDEGNNPGAWGGAGTYRLHILLALCLISNQWQQSWGEETTYALWSLFGRQSCIEVRTPFQATPRADGCWCL